MIPQHQQMGGFATYQTICGQAVPLRPHANDPQNGLVLHRQDIHDTLGLSCGAFGLARMDGRPVGAIVDQRTGVVFHDEFEVDLSQNYGVIVASSAPTPAPTPAAAMTLDVPTTATATATATVSSSSSSPMASPRSSPRAVRKARATPLCADADQTECVVCFQDIGHKAGRYSMNCRCAVKPCHHKLVCNACGVFFADETVKRREQPMRQAPGVHMHTEKFKVHCAACSQERYDRCLAAHMLPERVGNRKKRSPKMKRLAKTPQHTVVPLQKHHSHHSKGGHSRSTRADEAAAIALLRQREMMKLANATHRSAKVHDRLAVDSETEFSAAESNPGSPPEFPEQRSSHDTVSTKLAFEGLNLLSMAAAELERCPTTVAATSG